MADFTPGWYVVQPRDAQGHTQLKYFARRDRVTCACYTTADGRQVYLWGKTERPGGVADTWRASYTYRPREADGQWDAAQPDAAPVNGSSAPRSACEDLANACPACDRKGLLILPLRYAVARADVPQLSAAPTLADPFASGDDGIALPADLAQYTLRTLRPGYLYVFNEAWGSQGWSAHTVDAQGYLGEFDIHAKSPPLPDLLANAPCGRRPTAELARCIAIADAHLPERLGTVWLCFSATPWTATLVRRHMREPALRAANMRPFDARAWARGHGAAPQSHVSALDEGIGRIAEYSVLDSALHRLMQPLHHPWPEHGVPLLDTPQAAFADAPSDFHSLAGLRPQLLSAAAHAKTPVPVAVLALPDPVGIAIDLNAQIRRRAADWANQPLRRWKRETAQTIDALEMLVRNGAVARVSERRAATATLLGTVLPSSTGPLTRGRTLGETVDRAAHLSEEQTDAIGAEQWRDEHLIHFDDAARRHYLEVEHPQEQAAFEAAVLAPLDTAYLAWLQSARLRDHFRCNFDETDIRSGAAYAGTLALVLADASARGPVAEYLVGQLARDPQDPASVELRALLGNQKQAIDALVAQLPDSAHDAGALNWNDAAAQLWTVFAAALDTPSYAALSNGKTLAPPGSANERLLNAISRITYQLSGPIVRRLNALATGGIGLAAAALPERRLMTVMGALLQAENPKLRILDLRTQSSRKQATRMVAAAVAHVSGRDNQQYRSEIRRMLDAMPDAHEPRHPYRALLLIDEAEAARLAPLKGDARDAHLRTAVLQHEKFELLFQRSVGTVVDTKLQTSVVSAIFAAVSLHGALEAMSKASSKEKNNRIVNFAGGVAALTGGMLEIAEQILAKTAWGAGRHGFNLGVAGKDYQTRAKLVGLVGKGLSVVGGVIAGALMIDEGLDSYGVSPRYGSTMIYLGVATVISAVLLLLPAFSAIAFPLGLAITLITLVASRYKPTEIQKWLDACYYGRNGASRFTGLDEQNAQLALIVRRQEN